MSLEALYQGIDVGNALVIVGIAVEETPLLLRFATVVKEGLVEKRSRTGAIAWLRKRKKTAESIGFVILLIGLVLENGYEGAARTSVDNARSASERVTLRLTSQAADAEGKIADAKNDAAKANVEAERIKQSVQWRSITPAQIRIIARELEKDRGSITLAFISGDPETELFALELSRAISMVDGRHSSPPWKDFIQARAYSDRLMFGISVPGPENNQVKAVRRAFTAAGIPFNTNDVPDPTPPLIIGAGLTLTPPPKTDVLILIGLRAPPIESLP